ncbi:hypothetical protein [Haloferula sargassicola]|uniref:Tetratricopeptide repeat protein n=1 Tax=Haloferula sargassicola TaxID=490096 RepID=A0ABP9UJI0_9BACT
MAEAVHARSGLLFQLSCWVLGMVAFIQLLIGGVALALRVESAREVRVEEKIVTKLVNIAPQVPAQPAKPIVALPPAPEPIPYDQNLPAPRPFQAPPIADPVVERLVNEAREARVAEDMGSAIPKLEEAIARSPEEPNALYELGLVYETMAGFDTSLAAKAADAFAKVRSLGATGAGALYQLASKKLTEGIALPKDMRGKLSLGRVIIFPDNTYHHGERVILTIPVSAAPGSEPSANDFFVQVNLYDQDPQGNILPMSTGSQTEFDWVSGAIDWVGGQEMLRVTYTIPEATGSDLQLFGRRKYYGQTVELFYRNELIDAQANPRHLASEANVRQQTSGNPDPLFLNEGDMPAFDPNMPLLPTLENEIPVEEPLDLPPLDDH